MLRNSRSAGATVRALATLAAFVALISSGLTVGLQSVAGAATISTSIAVGANPLDIALNSTGTVAYVVNFNAPGSSPGSVSVIDLSTNAVTATITVGLGPVRIAVNSAGTYAYVANSGSDSVSVIDLSTNAVVDTMSLPAGAFPEQIFLTSSTGYVLDRGTNAISEFTYPYSTVTTPIAGLNSPEGIYISGTTAYITNRGPSGTPANTVSVVDLTTNAITSSITVGTSPSRIAADPTGTYLYVTNRDSNNVSVIQVSTNTVVATVPAGTTPDAVAVDPSGTYAYVSNTLNSPGTVSIIQLSNNTVVQTLTLGSSTDPEGITVNSAGTTAYAVDYAANQVSVIQVSSNAYSTVIFNGNSSTSGSMANESNNVPASLTTNTIVKTGYTFAGWNTIAAGGGTAYADGASYPFSTSTTLYAQWTANATDAYSYAAGVGGSGTGPASGSGADGTTITLAANTFVKSGYTFSCFNFASGSVTAVYDFSLSSAGSAITFTAQWTANATSSSSPPPPTTYTVTFNANGGTGSMSPESNNTSASLTLNTFTRSGYTFTGWNTIAAGGGTAYADGAPYPFNASTTLYAQWTANVTGAYSTDAYNYAAGVGGSGTGPASGSGADGTTITLAANTFVKSGYTFSGWNDGTATHPAGYVYTLSSAGSAITFTAQWTAVTPNPPRRLTASFYDGTIWLHWRAPANTGGSPVLGYNVFRGTTPGRESNTPLNGLRLIRGTSFKVREFGHGIRYYFIVKTVSAAGSSAASNHASVYVPKFVATRIALTLSRLNVPYRFQHAVTFIMRVTPLGAGRSLYGVVKIKAGSRVLCEATVSKYGSARCVLPARALLPGRHRLNATYGGDYSDRDSNSVARFLKIL